MGVLSTLWKQWPWTDRLTVEDRYASLALGPWMMHGIDPSGNSGRIRSFKFV